MYSNNGAVNIAGGGDAGTEPFIHVARYKDDDCLVLANGSPVAREVNASPAEADGLVLGCNFFGSDGAQFRGRMAYVADFPGDLVGQPGFWEWLKNLGAHYDIPIVDPNTPIVDDFAVDGALTETSPDGHLWRVLSASYTVSAGELSMDGGQPSASQHAAVVNTGSPDGIVNVDLSFLAASGFAGIAFRAGDTNADYLRVVYQNNVSSLYLTEKVGGVFTDITAPLGVALSPGDLLEVQFFGDQITVFVNGIDLMQGTSTVNIDSPRHGVEFGTSTGQSSTANRLANWGFRSS
jgi:hypothetical protein